MSNKISRRDIWSPSIQQWCPATKIYSCRNVRRAPDHVQGSSITSLSDLHVVRTYTNVIPVMPHEIHRASFQSQQLARAGLSRSKEDLERLAESVDIYHVNDQVFVHSTIDGIAKPKIVPRGDQARCVLRTMAYIVTRQPPFKFMKLLQYMLYIYQIYECLLRTFWKRKVATKFWHRRRNSLGDCKGPK